MPAVGGSRQWLLLSRPKPQVLPRSYWSLQGWAPVLLRPHPRVFRTPAPLPPFRFDVFARYHLSLICHPSVCLIYLRIGSKVKLDSCACFSKIESSTSEPRASTKGREKKVGLGTRDLVLNYRGIGSAEDVSLNVC